MTDAAYEEAFRGAEIDVAGLPRATAVAKIRSRPYAVRVAIASALDDWAAVRRLTRRDQAGPTELTEVARVADPDQMAQPAPRTAPKHVRPKTVEEPRRSRQVGTI